PSPQPIPWCTTRPLTPRWRSCARLPRYCASNSAIATGRSKTCDGSATSGATRPSDWCYRRRNPPPRPSSSRHDCAAPGDGCGRRGEEGYVPTLLGLSVMLPALFGAVLVHHPHVLAHPASLLGLGMGVFTASKARKGKPTTISPIAF